MNSQSIFSTSIKSLLASMIAAMTIINPAFAADAGGSSSGFASLIPLILIMVIFYFLLIRPQQKKLKEHRNLVDEIKRGDKVLTAGGLFGKVIDVKDDVLKIEIADGVRVNVKRDTIAGLTDVAAPKEKPVKKGKPAKKKVADAKTADKDDAAITDSQDKA
ncbi:preprotein translocase subunit YajC [Mariprofundus ferrooxydans]|nr:preprotein translocase subunit YajC [Mariprofundus ferrooxydans]